MNIDHSNVPRYMDLVPLSDISTGDKAAQVLVELFRNVAGHRERLEVYVTNKNSDGSLPGSPEFALPKFMDDYPGAVADYHTRMESVREKFAEIETLLRLILVDAEIAI